MGSAILRGVGMAVVVVAAAGGVAAGGAEAQPAGAVPKGAVVLAGTLPLSGAEARAGRGFKDGYELAVAQANAAGGVLADGRRRPVALVIADDQSDRGQAVKLLADLAEEQKPAGLLGTYSTSLALPQSAVAEKLQIPYVVGGASASEIFPHDRRWVFGLSAPTKMLAYGLLDWMQEQQRLAALPTPLRLAVAAESTAHGAEFLAAARAYAERSHGALQVVFAESFELGRKDFAPLVQKLGQSRADAFIADAHVQDFIGLHRQYREAGLCHRVVSYGARGTEAEARAQLGDAGVAYLLSAVWWQEGIAGSAESRAFAYAFRERYRRAPRWPEALGYESARVLLHAIEAAGTTSPDQVRVRLAADKIPSLLPGGQVSFPDSLGHQAHNAYVVQENLPDGSAPIIYPGYAATAAGKLNPTCGSKSAHADAR